MAALPIHITETLYELVSTLRQSKVRAKERAKVTHERFNIFTTLLDAADEVCLHTRFLHCLLDDQGCHDCNCTFLDLFFETLSEYSACDHRGSSRTVYVPPSKHRWRVEKEASVPAGRIDLLLGRPGFGLAIENKIFAAEQNNQLERYAKHVRQRFGDGLVLFLTLDGKPSVSHGGAESYLRISYEKHILAWLDKCLVATSDAPPVHQALQQYRSVVLQLTGNSEVSVDMKETTDFIVGHAELIRYRLDIRQSIDEVRSSVLDRLADAIICGMGQKNPTRLRVASRRFGTDPEGTLIVGPGSGSPLFGSPFNICFQHWATGQFLLVGIETNPPLDGGYPLFLEKIDEFIERESPFAFPFHRHVATQTWPAGWFELVHPFDDSSIADLATSGVRETADKLCADIRSYVALVERAFASVLSTTVSPESNTMPG